MTKKQISALQRMIARETSEGKFRVSGVHPSCGCYIVTDGRAAVVYHEKPDGLPESEPVDSLYDIIQTDIDRGNHTLALTATPELICEWKKMSRGWKAGLDCKTGAVPVKISTQREDGTTVSGFYNPILLVDAVEAIGPSPMMYIGRHSRNHSFCSLIVYPKNWMEEREHPIGYILPLRKL